MAYDNVGNLVTDTWTNPGLNGAMTYDADNHMTSAANGGHQYRYNADGKRVKRIISGQGELWMVYGIGGELVAEYNATSGIPAQTNPSKEYGYRGGQMLVIAEGTAVKWLVQDHLGSTRMEIAVGGALSDVTRHDFLPFGEELTGSMRMGNGYGAATNTKQKFTGYERDSETGLDFAQARYLSSVQGRFSSPDPLYYQVTMSIDPQRFNLYAYGRNNPLKWTDPTGERLFVSGNINWLIQNVLNPLTGGHFDDYFEIIAGEVVPKTKEIGQYFESGFINQGVELVLDLIASNDNYTVCATLLGSQKSKMKRRQPKLKIQTDSDGMTQDFTVKTMLVMPEIFDANFSDLKAFG